MASPAKVDEFLDLVRKSGVIDDKRLDAHIQKLRLGGKLPKEPPKLAGQLIADGFLTHFQAEQILQGKWRRFVLGKYKILEPIGSGGMGSVYLCEHKLMRRRVAVKVLPPAKAKDESALARFYREARAVAALDHPNIVHAYDIDQDGDLHFLIMEYVDGASLQEIIKKSGPMEVLRACHYMRQSALGLEQAHQKSLVHRDIKPGNILVDRTGVVKILDMGLARFFNDEDDILTRKFDENVLGTADYLAPEQIDDSHTVDIRADIYSLGATFYFILTGKTLFGEGTIGQKLLWHQNRQPKPVSEVRPEVPAEVSAIIMKMLSKAPEQRYQKPAELAEALAPFTQTPIGPPPDSEMPKLSLAATGMQPADTGGSTIVKKNTSEAAAPAPKGLQGLNPTGHKPLGSSVFGSAASGTNAAGAARGVAAVAAATTASLNPTPAEEEAEWAKIAADTGTNALGDTDRDSKKSDRTRGVRRQRADVKEKQRLKWVLATVGLVFLVGLIIGLVLLFRPTTHPVSDVRLPLRVTKQAGEGFYKSIQIALHSANHDDVIELLDPTYEDNALIDLSGKRDFAVTLRAAPGREVRWISKSKVDKTPLLRLNNAAGFKLEGKGITMDGKGLVDNLIEVALVCPGLTIDGLQLEGFAKSAIVVTNARGDKGRPIEFKNLNVIPTRDKKSLTAIFFGANPSIETVPRNNHITIADCEFNGLPIDADPAVMDQDTEGVRTKK